MCLQSLNFSASKIFMRDIFIQNNHITVQIITRFGFLPVSKLFSARIEIFESNLFLFAMIFAKFIL